MDRQQTKYEAKKAKLKRIKWILGDRLEEWRSWGWPLSREQEREYSKRVRAYTEARDKLDHYIKTSCLFRP